MLLLCSCIVLYCSYACCMLFVLVLCICVLCIVVCTCIVYFSYSGMEERLCRMPEFKHINQSINQSNQLAS